jgi:hypothetical protein
VAAEVAVVAASDGAWRCPHHYTMFDPVCVDLHEKSKYIHDVYVLNVAAHDDGCVAMYSHV